MIPESKKDGEESASSTRASGDDPEGGTAEGSKFPFYPRKRG